MGGRRKSPVIRDRWNIVWFSFNFFFFMFLSLSCPLVKMPVLLSHSRAVWFVTGSDQVFGCLGDEDHNRTSLLTCLWGLFFPAGPLRWQLRCQIAWVQVQSGTMAWLGGGAAQHPQMAEPSCESCLLPEQSHLFRGCAGGKRSINRLRLSLQCDVFMLANLCCVGSAEACYWWTGWCGNFSICSLTAFADLCNRFGFDCEVSHSRSWQ